MRRNGISLYFIFALFFIFSLCFVIQANAYLSNIPAYTRPYWTLYNYPLGIQNTYGFSGQYGPYGLYGSSWGLYGGVYPWGSGAWGLYGGLYGGYGLYGGIYGLYGGAYPGLGLYGGLYGPGWW